MTNNNGLLPWIKINSMDDMPKKVTTSYEQYDCVCLIDGEIHHLVWNCEHEVFDDRSGDDYECDYNKPSHYFVVTMPDDSAQPQNVDGDLDEWIKAQAAKDYNGLLVQFRAMKCLLNSQGERLSWYVNKDYSLSEARLKELNARLESEREMNAELTAEIEKLSHPKPEPSGDVKAALDALYWIVTNGQFTEEQTEELTSAMQIVERAITAQQPVNKELLEALQCLWDLHLDATGKKKRDSQLDIDIYYNAVERKVKQAIARAEQKGG